MMGLSEWTRAQESRLLCEKPIVTVQGNAMVDGKIVKGGGFFFLANPAFAHVGNILAASASNKYEFEILDLDGNRTQTYAFKAPDADATEMIKIRIWFFGYF